ncbi:MAG: 4'-phosphopantetheinyl transferase superfamily protein [Myxococcales bacterium]|nr:4'-phosphopantetheinyl transferase superfamily protein [Myxococcales bacterium]MDH5305736.1 4'-phosphopantetheinyl transferase superfamily protein [Myxococcales bacterium]
MLGNDVVDLDDAECGRGAHHPRFDARVFVDAERRAIDAAPEPDRMRWILWAAKESAYKALRRRDRRAIFSPRRFRVDLDAGLCGRVHHPRGVLAVRIALRGRCVHAIAALPWWRDAAVMSGVDRVAGADPSRAVRTLARAGLARRLELPTEAISIVQVGRVPQLRILGTRRSLPISLSHHGDYVAWACGLRLAPALSAAQSGGLT